MSIENYSFQQPASSNRSRASGFARSLISTVVMLLVTVLVAYADTYRRDTRHKGVTTAVSTVFDQAASPALRSAGDKDAAFPIDDIQRPAAAKQGVRFAPGPSAAISPEVSDVVSPESSHPLPIRHAAPLHEQMVTPGNFEYLGAFRPPHVKTPEATFSFGGWAMAYYDRGDEGGENDGHPGSLFLTGHRQQDLVAEISIPRPLISATHSMDELPVASVLQPLSDMTGGIRKFMTQGSSEPFQIGGLCVVSNRLHWTLYKYYNVQTIDYPSHGTSSLTLSNPAPEGLWHLGPSNSGQSQWNSYKHAGYIFDIPEDQARQWWFGGRNLISGLQIATGLNIASHGPAMFAYSLPVRNAAERPDVDAIPLLYNDLSRPSPEFVPSDRWTGGAWLTLNDKQTVIITGRKSLGQSYYGEARPQDCSTDKGFHGAPYEAQVRFYAPQALAASAAGKTDPTSITPWDVWDHDSPGGGFNQYLFPACAQFTGGLAYDRKNNLLYLAQIDAGTTTGHPYEPLPVIHVFRIVP